MNLKITAIREVGDVSKERIVLKALAAADVGNFVIFCTGLTDGVVNVDVQKTFWFPNKKVNTGDFVVVYTKSGTSSAKDFNGVKSHFFYWGESDAIWSRPNTSAVLLRAPEWETFQAES
jgi:hypothetical protein